MTCHSVFQAVLGIFVALSIVNPVVLADFSFYFSQLIRQCENTTVVWPTIGGEPPFRILLIPVGSIHPEVRLIHQYTFPNNSNSLTFPITYPGNSKFIAVASDASRFGVGGSSAAIQLEPTDDASCLSKSQVSPKFYFFTDPSVPKRCSPMNISYDARADPPVDIYAIVPGSNLTNLSIFSGSLDPGSSFQWFPPFDNFTSVLLLAGDKSGIGTGGSTDILTVAPGNASCPLPLPRNETQPKIVPTNQSPLNKPSLSISILVLIASMAAL